MEAFVFINTHGGRAEGVFKALGELKHPGGSFTHLSMLEGPFDIVGRVEGPNSRALCNLLTEGIRRIEGVAGTTTCLHTGNIYRAE